MLREIERNGPEDFAEKILSNRRTLSGGLLRAARLQEALRNLIESDVNTIDDLRNAIDNELKNFSREWQRVRGLGLASWDYFLMNAGLDGVKVDVRIRRFFTRAIGESSDRPSDEQIKEAFTHVARMYKTSRRRLDRAVWLYEGNR